MLAILLVLALAQPASARPTPRATPRDLTTTDSSNQTPLQQLTEAAIKARIAALVQENKRSFSDSRALLIEELQAELDRRAHERQWEEEERKREAARKEADAKLEANFLAEQQRKREVDQAAASALALARNAAEEEARIEAELRAQEERRSLLRLGLMGALALAGIVVFLAVRKRR